MRSHDLDKIVRELAVGWRSTRRHHNVDVDESEDGIVRLVAWQCDADTKNYVRASVVVGLGLLKNLKLGMPSLVVEDIARLVNHVTGMVDDIEKRNDPRTPRLRWHRRGA